MARLFQSGAELGSAAADGWDVVNGTVNLDSANARSGADAFSVAADSSYLQKKNLAGGVSIAYFARVYVKFAAAPSARTAIMAFAHTGTLVGEAYLETGRTVTLRLNNGTALTTSSALAVNTWHRIEVQANYPASGAATLTLVVNGTTVGSGTGSASTVNQFDVGATTSAAPGTTFYYDDIALNDSTTGSDNTYPGAGAIFGHVESLSNTQSFTVTRTVSPKASTLTQSQQRTVNAQVQRAFALSQAAGLVAQRQLAPGALPLSQSEAVTMTFAAPRLRSVAVAQLSALSAAGGISTTLAMAQSTAAVAIRSLTDQFASWLTQLQSAVRGPLAATRNGLVTQPQGLAKAANLPHSVSLGQAGQTTGRRSMSRRIQPPVSAAWDPLLPFDPAMGWPGLQGLGVSRTVLRIIWPQGTAPLMWDPLMPFDPRVVWSAPQSQALSLGSLAFGLGVSLAQSQALVLQQALAQAGFVISQAQAVHVVRLLSSVTRRVLVVAPAAQVTVAPVPVPVVALGQPQLPNVAQALSEAFVVVEAQGLLVNVTPALRVRLLAQGQRLQEGRIKVRGRVVSQPQALERLLSARRAATFSQPHPLVVARVPARFVQLAAPPALTLRQQTIAKGVGVGQPPSATTLAVVILTSRTVHQAQRVSRQRIVTRDVSLSQGQTLAYEWYHFIHGVIAGEASGGALAGVANDFGVEGWGALWRYG